VDGGGDYLAVSEQTLHHRLREQGLQLRFVAGIDLFQVISSLLIIKLPLRLSILFFSFRIRRPPSAGLVSQTKDPLLLAIDATLHEPGERRLEQQQVVLFPHRVMRGARQIDKHLLRGTQVRV